MLIPGIHGDILANIEVDQKFGNIDLNLFDLISFFQFRALTLLYKILSFYELSYCPKKLNSFHHPFVRFKLLLFCIFTKLSVFL